MRTLLSLIAIGISYVYASPQTAVPSGCKLRTDWRSLTRADQEAFGRAWAQLHRQQEFIDYVDEHANFTRHNTQFFLSDHRDFVLRVENELEQFGWTRGMPYYDSTAGELVNGQMQWQIFDDDSLWSVIGGGEENAGNCLRAPFNSRLAPGPGGRRGCVTRTFDRSVPLADNAAMTRIVVGVTNENEFSNALNGGQHAFVHIAVGGSMGFLESAAADPFFYLHHAYVDMLWSSWQRIHRNVEVTRLESECYVYDRYYGQATINFNDVASNNSITPTSAPGAISRASDEDAANQVLAIGSNSAQVQERVLEDLKSNQPARQSFRHLGINSSVIRTASDIMERAIVMDANDDLFNERQLKQMVESSM